MVGDIYLIDGVEFEVVWAGGEGLVPPRETKMIGLWTPPKRLYNKTSEYWKQDHKKAVKYEEVVLRDSDPNEDVEDSGRSREQE